VAQETCIDFNPNATGSVTVKINATDPGGSGVANVSYPDLDGIGGMLWNPAGGSTSVGGGVGGSTYGFLYNWAFSATDPLTQSATATDNAGNSATANFQIIGDPLAATGGTISYFNGYVLPTAATITTLGQGIDNLGGSGIGRWQLQRSQATLMPNGSCAVYGSWTDVGPLDPPVGFTDATVVAGNCYNYREQVWDNVENLATFTSANDMKVDTPSIDATIFGPSTVAEGAGGATVTLNVRLHTQPTAPVTVNLNGGGQLSFDTPILTFDSSNWNIPVPVTVSAIDDAIAEGPHTGTISFFNTSADPLYNNIITAPITLNIIDNDVAGVVVTQTGGVTEVYEGGATDTYLVHLSSEPTANVTVTPQPDATLTTSGPVTFTNLTWATDQIITVTAIDDNVDQPRRRPGPSSHHQHDWQQDDVQRLALQRNPNGHGCTRLYSRQRCCQPHGHTKRWIQ